MRDAANGLRCKLGRMIDTWRQAYAESTMVGWDFSRLDGRLIADEPWWNFEDDCRSEMAGAQRIVDLGTGGGERLQRLLDGNVAPAAHTVATEGWEPNLVVAREGLSPHGVEVVRYDAESDRRMPFGNDTVDLVMSRHETIDASEIARV